MCFPFLRGGCRTDCATNTVRTMRRRPSFFAPHPSILPATVRSSEFPPAKSTTHFCVLSGILKVKIGTNFALFRTEVCIPAHRLPQNRRKGGKARRTRPLPGADACPLATGRRISCTGFPFPGHEQERRL